MHHKFSLSLLFLLGVGSLLAQTPVQEAYLKASTLAVGSAGARFGTSVDVDGHFAVSGAPYEDSGAVGVNTTYPVPVADSGAVCVFRRSGVWAPEAYLKPFNVDSGDHFGWSVAISGNTVVVGAPDEDSATAGAPFENPAGSVGAAYVFVRNEASGAWSQQAFLKPPVDTIWQYFGYCVDVEGDLAVIGAPAFGEAVDKAYIFRRSGGVWTQEAVLAPAVTPNNKAFGATVAISGDTVVVGAPFDGSVVYSMGSTYVFKRTPATGIWTQQALLLPESETSQDFGSSVSISGDVLVVGAPREGSNATGVGGDTGNTDEPYSGAAFVYRRAAGVWSLEAYLKASNTDPDDHFGSSVAVDGDVILVGAAFEQGSATGVNGNQALNDADRSGAVYRFTRTAGVWAGSGYLKAGNTGAGDEFGGPTIDWIIAYGGGGLALDGSTAIIGAALEDGGSRGVGGNPADESAVDAGAAYVFENIQERVPKIRVQSATSTLRGHAVGSVNFGMAILGGDAQRVVEIHNVGRGILTVGTPSFTGPTASDFSISPELVEPIPAGAKISVQVRFAPGSLGTRRGILHLPSNDPYGLLSIDLQGEGVCVEEPDGSSAHVPVSQEAYIKADNTIRYASSPTDRFGSIVAISGNTMVVGAPFESSDGLTTHPPDPTPEFGPGAISEDSGAAYVFVRHPTNGTWTQQAYLKAPGSQQRANFGETVAIDGDVIVVGAPLYDRTSPGETETYVDSGAAFVFARNQAGHWVPEYTNVDGDWMGCQYPAPPTPWFPSGGGVVGQRFGSKVAISNNRILVSAPYEYASPLGIIGGERGAVYSYERVLGGGGYFWNLRQRLVAPAELGANVGFGHGGLAVSAERCAIGVTAINEYAGGVLAYRREAGEWVFESLLEGEGTPAEVFGAEVALDTTAPLVTLFASPGQISEYVRVFVRDAAGTWSIQSTLRPAPSVWWAPDPNYGLRFGWSISAYAGTLVVGAPFESSDALGVNIPASGTPRQSSGAVFVFRQDSPGIWSQKAVVKAFNADSRDEFGGSVALYDGTLAVGAPNEDSSARGVGGNPFSNNTHDAGAAYIFTGLQPAPEVEVTRTDTNANIPNGATVAFASTPPGRTRSITFRLANLGDRNLTLSPSPSPDISIVGDLGQISITSSPSDPVAAGGNTTFTVAFTPVGTGNRSATITILNSDLDESTTTIHLTGYAPTPVEDLDADGIPDAEEFDLEAAGFRAGQDDSTRAAAITGHAPVFDLYNPADLQLLVVDAPLIFHNPLTDEVTLTLGLQKSTDLLTFGPFPATAPQVHVNPLGKIEFTFPATDPRAYFRVEAR